MRTDGHDEANRRFSRLRRAPLKIPSGLIDAPLSVESNWYISAVRHSWVLVRPRVAENRVITVQPGRTKIWPIFHPAALSTGR